jgi:lactate dehydrogenase-like 2-hydroxyacid dehydrogenase
MLSLAKRLPEIGGFVTAQALESGGFDPTPFDRRYTANSNFARVSKIRTLAGATIAIIGLGAIGREIARIAGAFEMRIRYFQRHPLAAHEEWTLGVSFGTLGEILAEADFVSVNLPLNAETRDLIDAELLSRFKRGAVLVNVARAELVERGALVEALDSGRLGGYGLDVGYEEPTLPDDPLLGRPNVLLTPHTAVGSRVNAIRDMEQMYGRLWRALNATE